MYPISSPISSFICLFVCICTIQSTIHFSIMPGSQIALQRSAAQGWVTRTVNSLKALLQDEALDAESIQFECNNFDKRLEKFDEVQANYELVADDMDQAIQEAFDFRAQAMLTRIDAAKSLKALIKDEIKSTSSNKTKPEITLPELELTKFDGNVLEWESFWDQFVAVVDSCDMPDVNKFRYLKSVLTKEAADAIQGFSTTDANYQEACNLLKKRFGRKERIIFRHFQELLGLINTQKSTDLASLKKLQDTVEGHVRSLACLGINGDQFGVALTPIIVTCLPNDLRMLWLRKSIGKEQDLKWLLEFLDAELRLRETSRDFVSSKPTDKSKPAEQKPKASCAVLSATSRLSCGICAKGHPTSKCWELTEAPMTERQRLVRSSGMCIRCLGTGHQGDCEEVCSYCDGAHHQLLCYKQKHRAGRPPRATAKYNPSKKDSKEESTTAKEEKKDTKTSKAEASVLAIPSTPDAIMQLARLQVRGKDKIETINVLFDSGSARTWISSSLIKRIQLSYLSDDYVSSCAFGNSKASEEKLSNIYRIALKGPNSGWEEVDATETPIICAPLFKKNLPDSIRESCKHMNLLEEYTLSNQIVIDVLIGLTNYWRFMKPNIVVLSEEPGNYIAAQKSTLGWILSGCHKDTTHNSRPKSQASMLCIHSMNDDALKRVWDADVNVPRNESNKILKDFEERIKFEDERYEVSLPWINKEECKLMNNFAHAKLRLQSLTKKLNKNKELKKKYNEALQEMEENGVIEVVPSKEIITTRPVYYLPHRPVVKVTSTSTPVRPVFDASAPGPNGVSLNDCMEAGPNMMPLLCDVIVRFRRWPIAILADIKKAFLQIAVSTEHRDVHRFLWELNEDVRVMRFTRVPFGNRASPFILNATIKFHLRKFENTKVIEELLMNLYMDDWLTGADEEDEAAKMVDEGSEIMAQGGWQLAKWESNKNIFDEKENFFDPCKNNANSKVLGLKWNKDLDCFEFEIIKIDNVLMTKRIVLSIIARTFDPMGYLAPFVMKLKIIFQEIWRQGFQWDESLPHDVAHEVLSWIEDLAHVEAIKVPRSYTGTAWRELRDLRLEAFGDASEKANGACVYLVATLPDSSIRSMLVMSKSRVCPLKKITLPCLELLGALLAAKLLLQVKIALHAIVICRYWTDSTCVLNWIKGDPHRWKTFVSNRVAQIQEISNPAEWFHCPGKSNPADALTRGLSASEISQSELWLKGPTFITDESAPHLFEDDISSADEVRESDAMLLSTQKEIEPVFKLDRWDSLRKAIRVAAWTRRFINAFKIKDTKVSRDEFSVEELSSAKLQLIKETQREHFQSEIENLQNNEKIPKTSKIFKLSPFLDEDGVLRLKGRLDFSSLSFDEKQGFGAKNQLHFYYNFPKNVQKI